MLKRELPVAKRKPYINPLQKQLGQFAANLQSYANQLRGLAENLKQHVERKEAPRG